MAGGGLAGLSREELLELVRRQRAELAPREAAIERREERIRELEGEPSQLGGPDSDPGDRPSDLTEPPGARFRGVPRNGGAPWWAMTFAVDADTGEARLWAYELRPPNP